LDRWLVPVKQVSYTVLILGSDPGPQRTRPLNLRSELSPELIDVFFPLYKITSFSAVLKLKAFLLKIRFKTPSFESDKLSDLVYSAHNVNKS
jgi:hypothetical protein